MAAGIAQLRAAFVAGRSAALSSAVGGPVMPWAAMHKVSAITRCYVDDQRFVVVVGGFEPQHHVDRGLAYGLALAGDRDLVLVLPEGTEVPTLRPIEGWEATLRLSASTCG